MALLEKPPALAPRDTADYLRLRERIAEGASVLPGDLQDVSREVLIRLVVELNDLLP